MAGKHPRTGKCYRACSDSFPRLRFASPTSRPSFTDCARARERKAPNSGTRRAGTYPFDLAGNQVGAFRTTRSGDETRIEQVYTPLPHEKTWNRSALLMKLMAVSKS